MAYVILFTEKQWLIWRELGYVEFTDDEFASASSRNGLIKRGWVPGAGEADMYIDPRIPCLQRGNVES
jgi:hypothetical protein